MNISANRIPFFFVCIVGYSLFLYCIPRDNPYDPLNPDFVMPQFSCTIQLRDETNAGVEHAAIVYSYDNRIDTIYTDSGSCATIIVEKNSAEKKISARILSVEASAHHLDEAFDVTLSREGSTATVFLHDLSVRPVLWDTLGTHADTAGVHLVWHASNADEFSYYRLMRYNRMSKDTDTVAVVINRRDTVFSDFDVEENEDYTYRMYVVSPEATVGGNERTVTVPNRSPTASQVITVAPDFFIYLQLRWEKNTNSDFSRYTVYRGTDSLVFDSVVAVTDRIDTVWRDTTIDQAARRYYYYLKTVDEGGLSSASDTVSQVNRTTIERSLVYIHAGPFIMGRSGSDVPLNQQPAHTVILSSYLIDRYEVTVERYAAFLNDGNSTWYNDSMAAVGITRDGSGFVFDTSRAHYPMTWLSWSEADTFCSWDGGYLPTEAQWEKAARGTDGRLYPWGNDFYLNQSPTDFFLANYIVGFIPVDDSGYSNDGARSTAPVGNYASGVSLFGLYDMAGNVSEWCYDWYANDFPADSIDPEGPELGLWRSYRGGSFKNYPEELLVTSRYRYDPSARRDDLGCRCAYRP
jgi:formylglycine-generating enzyme required for sulfatase activity